MKKRKRKSRRAKRGTHASVKGGTFNYRSSWELKYATWLDASLSVLSYRYEPFAVEYVSNVKAGRTRRYYPDFEVTYVGGAKQLVEVKPAKKLAQARNVKKFAAARLFCERAGMAFVVVTEAELKALGLLK